MTVLLLLHAFPFDARMWEGQEPVFEEAGYQVIAPSLPGRDAADSTLSSWATRVLDLLPGDFIPVGVSMGGYLAFELWRQAPDRIAGLGLIGTRPGADSAEAKEGREATLRLIADGGLEALWGQIGPKLTAQPGERAREIALAQDPAQVAAAVAAIRDRPDSTALLSELSVPALVVAGSDDALIPPAESVAMAKALPRAQLVLLPGVGHLPPLERPEELAGDVLRLLDELA